MGTDRRWPLTVELRGRVCVEILEVCVLKTLLKRATAGVLALGWAGCQSSHPPPRVDVPQRPSDGMVRERDEQRPMPTDEAEVLAPPPFTDAPLVVQSPPEQRAYLRAYDQVGRPRILVAVNRDVAPATVTRRTDPDSGRAVRSIDHEAVEVILTDWLAADGQVEVLSPQASVNTLTDAQKQGVRSGDAEDVARDTGADVIVTVRSRMTEQGGGQDLMLRMVAEAVNAGDGRSIGRAVVDVPPPLDKPQINKYTRFLARKLMDGMILSWQRMSDDDEDRRAVPQGTGANSTDRVPAPAVPEGPESDSPVEAPR